MSELDELFMQRRMGIVSRAQDLSPSMQFDLAASGLANHELEEAVSHFNPKPQKEGWGFANVFEEMLSREPRRVPVEDLATLQNNLKQQGYLPPDHPADGVWGPDSASAFNQFDRDNGDQVRQGNSILAGTVQDGIRFFGTMLPRSVIQGVIGTAKGLVEQAPETLERGGLIGGALAGAAVGGAAGAPFAGIGAIPGAIGGAVIGGIGGFLSSLLDNDDEDGNGNSGILDALHPFNEGEWTTARNFAEDAGFVATAASMFVGGGTAVRGAKGLTTLKGSLTALDPVTKPGFVMNLLGSAKGSAALGGFAGGAHGLATGDDFGDVLQGAAIGGVGGFALGASPVGSKLRDMAARYGLKRINTNPVVKGINSTFTGGVQINVAGRYAGGFGSGEKDTAIERNIRDAPVVLPEWADLLGGMVLLPNRILPVNIGEIGSAARKMMGNTAKRPYFMAMETIRDATGAPLSKTQIRERIDAITPEEDIFRREQFGLDELTKARVETIKAEEGAEFAARTDIEKVYDDAHAEVVRWYEGDPASIESKKNIVMAFSTEDPSAFASYLVGLEQRGSGMGQWAKYEPAQIEAETLATAVANGRVEATIGSKVVGKADEAGAVATKPKSYTFVAAQPDYMTQKNWLDAADEYVRLQEQAKRARSVVESLADDVAMAEQSQRALLESANANDELMNFIRSFQDPNNKHRQLHQSYLDAALDGRQTTKRARGKSVTTYDFAETLKEKAKHAGLDVEIDPALTQAITENGYKLVATGRDIRRLADVKQLAATHDLGDYTKRASFFESAGLSPFRVTEKEIGQYKQQNVVGHLNQASAEMGVSLPGEDAFARLMRKVTSLNNPEGTKAGAMGPFRVQPGEGGIVSRTRLQVQDLRQLTLDDIVDALALDSGVLTTVDDPLKVAQRYKDAIHTGHAFGGEVSVRNPMDSARMLMAALRVEGLPGTSDFMRQFRFTNPPRALTIAGGAAGAGIGAHEEGLKGAIEGGIYGSLALGTASYGGKAFLKKWPNKSPFKPGTYGYLPNNLHNAAMALRYSLSFTFDLGRRMEQASIASMRHGLPGIVAPKSWARRHLADDFGGVDNVMTGLRAQLDDVMGSSVAMNADDMERRVSAVGITGFAQQDADAVYAHLLIKQGKMNRQQIREAVYELGHYGPRAGAERSLNFVMFPFSFQKKMLTTVGDFMLQEPARALLVHEGMRQWYQVREGDESLSEKWAEMSEKYLPMADTIARLNNLSYGISGGRFVLEGLMNNKTLEGKVAAGLAGVFTPGGSLTPLHQAAGKAGDQMVNFFTPIYLTGEDTENFIGIFEDFAPAVRDVRNIFVGRGENQPGVVSQQVTALTSRGATAQGGGGAPWYQLRQYNNEKRQIKAEYEDLAMAFGYTTVDGFLNSDIGLPYKADIEAKVVELGRKYPTGLAKSEYFESSTASDDQAKAELLSDPTRSTGEEMIAQLIEMEAEAGFMADMLGLTSDEMLPRLTADIRSIATRFSTDMRFRELYDRFFSYRYGPVAEVAA